MSVKEVLIFRFVCGMNHEMLTALAETGSSVTAVGTEGGPVNTESDATLLHV